MSCSNLRDTKEDLAISFACIQIVLCEPIITIDLCTVKPV